MATTNDMAVRAEGRADHSPATVQEPPAPENPAPPPAKPFAVAAAYVAAAALLIGTQGLGMNFVAANTSQIQGAFGATQLEINWLIAAYMAPNVSLTLILTKVRTQFGLRRFAEIGICIFVTASLLHLLAHDLHSAIGVRFLAGMAASPISTLGFLYMLEAFPPARKMSWGLSLALTCSAVTPTMARLISPVLLDIGQWQGLYMMAIGLALISLAVIFYLPLTPIPHAKVLQRLDFISYPLIAIGFGLLAVILVMGRLVWWLEAPWVGWCLALAILSLGLAVAIEINRETPLLNVRWLMSREMLHITAVLLVFRIVLSEQTSGALALFQNLGLLNEQSRGLYVVILLASLCGGLLCGATLKPERVPLLHGVALLCICAGAAMDSQATNLTRPDNMYLSQALIAFGGALFLPPAMLTGLMAALRQGPTFITSFIVVFLFTQSLGGLIGSAFFGSFVTLREKFHSSLLVEHLSLSDPAVAERLRQLSAVYGKLLTDGRLLNAEGVALFAQQASREANILAYNDAFLLIAVLAGTAFGGLIIHLLYARLRSARFFSRPAEAL
ncbi:MFS transporter [Bosea sp. BIWAKO-01]|uniref:MFS transporter n=1 Tax=Bosea sp. BIWAKO-01 TaxID=506668 RepID=UPI000869EA13|nr:MFS transporter [Bosea sp. BIWAKO-01]GAU82682.1 multidrug resistance protein B [Bosea sp. BIWAKO-01]